MIMYNGIIKTYLKIQKVYRSRYEFNQKVLQSSRTVSLDHSCETTAPKFSRRWALRTIFDNGTMLANFAPPSKERETL